jgi:uncharacterized protein YfaS (alpha-2-macroglobulin family)
MVSGLFMLLFVGICGAQEPTPQPYFSISTQQTYAPGEKPVVHLWSQNVTTLEFRVYKVTDPQKFFDNLQDFHRFGGAGPRVPHVKTWLERFHEWKYRLWARIRDFIRAQFTPNVRETIRDWRTGNTRSTKGNQVNFAQVPLLNSQQVVAVWRQGVGTATESWRGETIKVDVHDKGLYLVEATNGTLRAYTIVLISEIGVITKSAPGHMLAFVANRKTGAPIAGATAVVKVSPKLTTSLHTLVDGIAETPIQDTKPEDVLLMVKQGDDFAVNSPMSYYLNNDPKRMLVSYVYTDRPVYRPGDTVHYKIVARTRSETGYRIPSDRTLHIELRGPEYKTILSKDVTASDSGSTSGDYLIPKDAALGDYALQVGAEEAVSGSATFYIEEYKKPEYQVRVTPVQPRVLQGEKITATIDARYYFGEPVANAKVKYVVHVAPYWPYFRGEDEDQGEGEQTGGEDEQNDQYFSGEQTVEASGQLDADGRLQITIPTSVSPKKRDLTYRIEARVTDAGNREIAGHGYALATYGTFWLRIEPTSYVQQPGENARLTIQASDYDNKPVQTPLRVELVQWNWRNQHKQTITTVQGSTGADGKGEVDVPIKTAGTFIAKVLANTPEKREVESSTYLWVAGAGEAWWGAGQEKVQIVPDKKAYKPGDTAKVLVITGARGLAYLLVTTEGNDLNTHQIVKATGPTVSVDVPIRAEYAPNFYVSVAFLNNNKFYSGDKSLPVPPDQQKLAIEVEPSQKQFQPGQAATYTIRAHNADGHGVAADFSVGVVDEAIYAIRPETTPDILNYFYGRVYNRVGTDSSLSYYFQGESGKRRMQLTEVRPSSSLAQLKPERLVQPKIRKAFPDTAYWVASVHTDSSGQAKVHFDFPDALTSWRATVRGITADTKVGSAVQNVIVRKNVMVRLAVPRFFRQGDEVTVSVLVHNYLESAKTARVSLDFTGMQVVQGNTQDVNVPSRGEAKVDWRVKPENVKQVTLLAKALTDQESDAMQIDLPVIPYGVKLALSHAGSISEAKGEASQDMTFPAHAVPTSRSLDISITPSLAGAVFGALNYLTSYPYGCTEQTMSGFLPDIVVAQATKNLGIKSDVDPTVLQKKINDGLDRLYQFQHEDGGWGWWQSDDSHVFMTAYVLAGMAQAQAAGYAIKDGVIERAQQWLRPEFEKDKRIVPDLRAYMVYALVTSGVRDAKLLDTIWTQRSDLSPYGEALLGLAMNAAGDARSTELAQSLQKQVKESGQEAHWQLDRDPLMGYYGDASPETTAFALKLLLKAQPQSSLIPKAAQWLVIHRDQGEWWESTKQTAMVVYGLTDYLKQSGELKPEFTAEVWVDGKLATTKKFSPSDALLAISPQVHVDSSQLSNNSVNIKIRKNGAGTLYWSARAPYYSDEEKMANKGKIGLTLAREYFKLVPNQQGERIVYDLQRLSGPLQPGDVLAVRLTISGGQWRYLMTQDPIPAGTEFIERDDLYEIKDKPPWWSYWFTRREFQDDRAAMFQTYFDGGQREYFYLLKVVNPGVFRVSPAQVEPMYQPGELATSDSQTVEVK